jgi:hypothetical protein
MEEEVERLSGSTTPPSEGYRFISAQGSERLGLVLTEWHPNNTEPRLDEYLIHREVTNTSSLSGIKSTQ